MVHKENTFSEEEIIPGQIILHTEDVVCNRGKKTLSLAVKNRGDRPIQVGSHFHFFEVNKWLDFDRAQAFGMRLNIPASTAIRFEPGEEKSVTLIPFGGKRQVYGFNALVNGALDKPEIRAQAIKKMNARLKTP